MGISRRLLDAEITVETDGQQLTQDAADSFKVFEDDGDEDDGLYYNHINFNSRRRGGIYDEQDADVEVYHDLYQQLYTDDGWDHEEESTPP